MSLAGETKTKLECFFPHVDIIQNVIGQVALAWMIEPFGQSDNIVGILF